MRSNGPEHSLENGEKLAESWATEAEIEWRDGTAFLREQAVSLTAHRFGNPDTAMIGLPI